MITPTGIISTPLERLRLLIAATAAFQAWAGASDAGSAGRRGTLVDPPAPLDADPWTVDQLRALRPFYWIDEWEAPSGPGGDGWIADRVSLDGWSHGGKLIVWFEDNVAQGLSAGEAKVDFLNRVGAVLAELEALGDGNSAMLSIHRITRYDPYARCDTAEVESQGDHARMSFIVQWGV